MSASSQSIYQSHVSNPPPTTQQGPVLSTFQSQTKVSYVSQSGGVVYAQPSQLLCGSPTATRRVNSFRSQSAERKSGMLTKSNFSIFLNCIYRASWCRFKFHSFLKRKVDPKFEPQECSETLRRYGTVTTEQNRTKRARPELP